MIINTDWLQFSALKSNDFKATLSGKYALLETKRIRHWNKVFDLHKDGKVIAQVFTENINANIDPRFVSIRVENYYLYENQVRDIIEEIITACSLEFKHITRLDIAMDTQKISENISCQDFMNKVSQGFIIKKDTHSKRCIGEEYGQVDFNLVKHVNQDPEVKKFIDQVKAITRKFEAHGNKNCDTMVFGSRSSSRRLEMYNKTKEMAKKTHKPWIYDNWVKYGLDVSEPVFRVELSIKINALEVVDDYGEVLNKMDYTLYTNDFIKSLFMVEYNNQMQFAFKQGNTRFSRCKRVDLIKLEWNNCISVVPKINLAKQSSKYERGLIGRLVLDYQELRQTQTLYTIFNMLVRHSLIDWFVRKYEWYFTQIMELDLYDYLDAIPINKDYINDVNANFVMNAPDIKKQFNIQQKWKTIQSSHLSL